MCGNSRFVNDFHNLLLPPDKNGEVSYVHIMYKLKLPERVVCCFFLCVRFKPILHLFYEWKLLYFNH